MTSQIALTALTQKAMELFFCISLHSVFPLFNQAIYIENAPLSISRFLRIKAGATSVSELIFLFVKYLYFFSKSK